MPVIEILVGILLIVLLLIIDGFMIVKVLDWLDLDEDFRQAVRSWFGGRK
jgi:hypothetical protein